jgi:hypothetical protein
MKRTAFGLLAVVLAMGGCPATQPDPLPGVVTILTAGDYAGELSCEAVNSAGGHSTSTAQGKVLVTDAGGLRLFNSNISVGASIGEKQATFTTVEIVDAVEEAGDTVTVRTSGSITTGTTVITTAREATLKQVDPQTILLTDAKTFTATTGTGTMTCGGNVTR